MSIPTSTDPDFEKHLFALYGEEAAEWTDGGVTERVLREIDHEQRTRGLVMGAAAAAGGALSIALLAVFAGTLVGQAAETIHAPPLALWAALLAGAAAFSWAAARLAVEA
jgi:hypothetical protein